MTISARLLAEGPGWSVSDVVCTAGPHDRPFEEEHHGVSVALVTGGTFQYRSLRGSALLTPGAILLGNDRHPFQCHHDHGCGDRCLAFNFTSEFQTDVVAATPGVRRTVFASSFLPPLETLAPFLAAAEAARDDGDEGALEELAPLLLAATSQAASGSDRAKRQPNARDERRISESVRRIEEETSEAVTLAELARAAAMSPYHYLRTFRDLVGVTPYQFILRARLHAAALRLRRSNDNISTIALEAGFNDLSTFNRRFRRIMGKSPGAFRHDR